jgi:CheY-like chemotaxis protein
VTRTAAILDKDAFFREFQAFLLTRQGYNVVVPAGPEDYTAAWVISKRPDLVVTEIMLPGRNGLDLVRELRQAALPRCCIIVYSVLSAQARAYAAGADRFIHKPVMREAYLSAIEDGAKQAA